MASEVVMYQLLFVLGIFMFGFFTVSFNNFENYAETVTLDGNLNQVVEKVGSQILTMINNAKAKEDQYSNIEINMAINLDSQYANIEYKLYFDIDTTTQFLQLVAAADGIIYANYSLGIYNGTEIGKINASGVLLSSDASPIIHFEWNSSYAYDSDPTTSAEILKFM